MQVTSHDSGEGRSAAPGVGDRVDDLRAVPDLLTSLVHLMRAVRIAPGHPETLTHVQWSTLTMVARLGELRVSAIAEQMRVDLSVASRQIAQLEELGCVTRRPDPDDRRAMLVTISQTGVERIAVVQRARAEWIASALADWTPTEIDDAALLIDRLQAAMWAHADFAQAPGLPN